MEQGLVIKTTGSWYYVRPEGSTVGETIPCKIRGTFRIKGIRATNPVAVGDQVSFKRISDQDGGIIEKISERKNYIIRKSSNLSREYQLIACNIDQAILMASLISPRTYLEFIDRFLVSAEAFRIPVIIIFNKTDVYGKQEQDEMVELIRTYEAVGYRCIPASLKQGTNLDQIKDLLHDQVTVIAGNSGVGKSTLLNSLDPSLQLKTKEVSDYHKAGRHTTTYAEMHILSPGTSVIDTPGIKGYGMVDIEKEELFHFFPEIFEHSKHCKFNNCLHLNEPNCSVRDAVENGMISISRYQSYINLLGDFSTKYR